LIKAFQITLYTILSILPCRNQARTYKKYGFNEKTHSMYIDKIISRLRNSYLKDELPLICSDPLSKLSSNERLIRPLMLCREYGFGIDNIIFGIGAALHCNYQHDRQSLELQKIMQDKGLKNAV